MVAPRSAPPGRSGSWEAPGAHLVCSEGMEGKSPRCFEQNSQGTWMPFGARLFSWDWAVAGAGALPSLWGWAVGVSRERGAAAPGRARAGGSRRWVCVRQGESREGRMEAGGGSRGFRVILIPRGITTASLHSRTVPAPVLVPFHFQGTRGAPS